MSDEKWIGDLDEAVSAIFGPMYEAIGKTAPAGRVALHLARLLEMADEWEDAAFDGADIVQTWGGAE